MAIEYEISLGMLFRKMYCAGCGARLARKRVRKTYQRGEEGFRNTLSDGSTLNLASHTIVTYLYRCPDCGREISYEEQVKIAKKTGKTGQKSSVAWRFCNRRTEMDTLKRTILLGGLAGFINGLLLLLLGEGVIAFENRNLALPMVAFPVICLALSTGLFVYLFSKLTDRIGLFLLSDFLGFLFSTGLILLLYLEIVPVLFGHREVGAGVGFLFMIVYAGFCVLLLISRIISTLYLASQR